MSKLVQMSSQCFRHSLLLLTPLFVALFCGVNIADAEVSRDAVAMVTVRPDPVSVTVIRLTGEFNKENLTA